MFGSSNRTIIQTQTSKTTQKWVTLHKTKLLWPFKSSELNPVENDWDEPRRRSTVMELWIWRIWRDSGWRNCLVWQVFSNLIRIKFRAVKLANGGFKKYWKKGAVNCGQCLLEKNIYFIMIFPPFQILIIQWKVRFVWLKKIYLSKELTMQIHFHSLWSYLQRVPIILTTNVYLGQYGKFNNVCEKQKKININFRKF